jgi:Zn-dependent peptidase ImmA (M78 family)
VPAVPVSDSYVDPRAHALRARYLAVFGGAVIPVPVESIAEDLLGLAVEQVEMVGSGMLLPSERRILVNAGEPQTRQRFTVAHELGHWICHAQERPEAAPAYCRADEIGPDPQAKVREREANIFAAELLMPENAVRSRADDEHDLAARFGVSQEAMAWRLYNFGLRYERP